MALVVLRYGHRHVRDFRVTSHCCLVARAFGASRIEIIGEFDSNIVETLENVNERWGKGSEIEFFSSWKDRLLFYKNLGFVSVHLTMYGLPLQDVEVELKLKKDLLIIVGSQKVEREVYDLSDYNVSVTTQPHSEIAALAVFLDRIQEGKELSLDFNGKIKVLPCEKGKKVVRSQ